MERKLVVIWHSRTGGAKAMAEAILQGSGDGARMVRAEDATTEILLRADGYVFVGPENLGALTGPMKDMFDRTYYPLLGRVEGRAYATAIAAGSDGTGAQRQIDRIVTGWRLKRVAEPLIVNFAAQTPEEIFAAKVLPSSHAEACRALGEALVAGLEMGIF